MPLVVGWIATKIGLADVVVVEIACALDVIDVVVVVKRNRCSKRALGAFHGLVASANASRLLHGGSTTLKITTRDFTIGSAMGIRSYHGKALLGGRGLKGTEGLLESIEGASWC